MAVSDTTQSDKQAQDFYHRAVMHIRMTDAPTQIVTGGAGTYTAAQVLGGLITRDPTGGSRTDTLPSAAALVAAIPDERIGDTIVCYVMNQADQNETITIDAGTGGAFDTGVPATSKVIAQNASKFVIIRLTNVVAGSEAYVVYM